jgi:hypothetical protein
LEADDKKYLNKAAITDLKVIKVGQIIFMMTDTNKNQCL